MINCPNCGYDQGHLSWSNYIDSVYNCDHCAYVWKVTLNNTASTAANAAEA